MSNKICIDQAEKATPIGADRIPVADSADSNNTLWSTITNLATAIFGLKSTTDLSEGTNKYYTEDRVTANTTVAGLGTSKADKSNVLELDNTDAFTPDADYEPATKKYVDEHPTPDATTSVKGIVEMATDAEAETGTDETRYINSKQAKVLINPTAGTDIVAFSALTSRGTSSNTYTKLKEIQIGLTGTYTISFNSYLTGVYGYATIYKNGVAYGTEREPAGAYPGTLFTEDLSFVRGDLMQLYARNTSIYSTYVSNFKGTCNNVLGIVNTD